MVRKTPLRPTSFAGQTVFLEFAFVAHDALRIEPRYLCLHLTSGDRTQNVFRLWRQTILKRLRLVPLGDKHGLDQGVQRRRLARHSSFQALLELICESGQPLAVPSTPGI